MKARRAPERHQLRLNLGPCRFPKGPLSERVMFPFIANAYIVSTVPRLRQNWWCHVVSCSLLCLSDQGLSV